MEIKKEIIKTIEIKLNSEELKAIEKVVKLLLNLEDVLPDIECSKPLVQDEYGSILTLNDLTFMGGALGLLYGEGIAIEEKERTGEELC